MIVHFDHMGVVEVREVQRTRRFPRISKSKTSTSRSTMPRRMPRPGSVPFGTMCRRTGYPSMSICRRSRRCAAFRPACGADGKSGGGRRRHSRRRPGRRHRRAEPGAVPPGATAGPMHRSERTDRREPSGCRATPAGRYGPVRGDFLSDGHLPCFTRRSVWGTDDPIEYGFAARSRRSWLAP